MRDIEHLTPLAASAGLSPGSCPTATASTATPAPTARRLLRGLQQPSLPPIIYNINAYDMSVTLCANGIAPLTSEKKLSPGFTPSSLAMALSAPVGPKQTVFPREHVSTNGNMQPHGRR